MEILEDVASHAAQVRESSGRQKLSLKILTDTLEKERLEAESQIKEAQKSKKKSRAGQKGTAKRNITADLEEEEDFELSDTSSDESLHIGDTEEDVGKRIASYFVAKVLVKNVIEHEIEVLFWKRIFPSYKFQETTEKGRVSLEDALMKLPKPIPLEE
ncbi:hypothetical protein QYM36_016450 [Artemia franciscana]|uniref:Uncharacterized protein n=1 Tax=Artemia franciscana TaxID=6661 RepID=A0AA88KY48_ARTSF|nr:hypothetical protein QYM36_016450 [Artemia franciscana]